jgi:hypothetical protein
MRTLFLDLGFPLLLVAVVAWSVSAYAETVWGTNFGVVVGTNKIVIHDFASHLNFAKAFWRGEGGYSVDDHLRMTARFAGERLPVALPFGYSPTMLWILAPLCPLPTAWGFFAWTLLGLVAVLWLSRRYRSVLVAASFISPVALGCWKLGQTAIMTTVALIALMNSEVTAERTGPGRHGVGWGAVVLWALTAKPPLAVAAGTALLAGRRFRMVGTALGLTVVSTALLLPLLGRGGLAEYLGLLTHYDLDTAAPAFAWSLVPDTMGNVRALLHVTLGIGDAAATRWSTVLWLLASTSIMVTAARRAMPTEVRWSLAVLAYLLFCPHVSWTEEMQLVVILAAVGTLDRRHASIRGAIIGFVLVMLFLLPGIPFRGGARLPVAVAGKGLIGVALWVGWGSSRGRRATEAEQANTASSPLYSASST